jgi:hypothetical protein
VRAVPCQRGVTVGCVVWLPAATGDADHRSEAPHTRRQVPSQAAAGTIRGFQCACKNVASASNVLASTCVPACVCLYVCACAHALQIRSRKVLEQLERQQLSLRLRRESLRSSLADQLLRRSAKFEQQQWLDARAQSLADAAAAQRAEQWRVTAAAHAAAIRLAVMQQELRDGRTEREVFLRAQQLTLKRDARELLDAETRDLQDFERALVHAEER